jgi:arsenate reductase
MDKKTILVVCVHNSARSQMAEEYLRKFGGDLFEPSSAGIEPGNLNPFVVKVLQEESIDISGKKTQSTQDLYQRGDSYDYVVTVCSAEAKERCPIYPGTIQRFHWPFDDPSSFTGSDDEKLEGTRVVREQIKEKIQACVLVYRENNPEV